MFFKSFMHAKEKINGEKVSILGMLYGTNDEEFVVEEHMPDKSKYLSKLYKSIKDAPQSKILITDSGYIVEPYEMASIPLDLTKSSDKTNNYLLNYLGYGALINQLIESSILDTTTILNIMNNPQFQNDQTFLSLATYQNLFLSDKCISMLPLAAKICLYTKNVHRTQQIMDERKQDFNSMISTMLRKYLTHEVDFVSENPSDIRVNIIKTCNTFYAKDISFSDIKSDLIEIPQKEMAKQEKDVKAIRMTEKLISAAISNTATSEEDMVLYKRAKEINASFKDNLIKKSEETKAMITILKNFPN